MSIEKPAPNAPPAEPVEAWNAALERAARTAREHAAIYERKGESRVATVCADVAQSILDWREQRSPGFLERLEHKIAEAAPIADDQATASPAKSPAGARRPRANRLKKYAFED